MRTIDETPRRERYLMVAERVSSDVWRSVCEGVHHHLAKTNTGCVADMMRLIDSKLSPTSHPFVVLFSYADIPAGTAWNIAFDPTNRSSVEPTTAVLQFAIVWQRTAQTALEHGHHQIAMIDFPNGVPALLASLPIDANQQTYSYIGLCDSRDLRAIQAQNENVAEPLHARERRWSAET